MAGLIIAPVLLTDNDNQERLIAVFEDDSNYSKKLEDSENISFNLIDQSEAEKFKKDIIDKKRISVILKNISKKSKMKKIDPKITDKIWRTMIRAFIDYEFRNFGKK